MIISRLLDPSRRFGKVSPGSAISCTLRECDNSRAAIWPRRKYWTPEAKPVYNGIDKPTFFTSDRGPEAYPPRMFKSLSGVKMLPSPPVLLEISAFSFSRVRAPVLLFKRLRHPYYVRDRQMGWGARSEGGVEICEINCRHAEVLRPPHVQIIGQKLASRSQGLRDRQRQSTSVLATTGHAT
jgi:hypothetical protein